jgi:hypothetical protein
VTNQERLKEVKERFSISKENRELESQFYEDMSWLISRAETLQKIEDTWVSIETNGTKEEADNFYTIVQDILTKQ